MKSIFACEHCGVLLLKNHEQCPVCKGPVLLFAAGYDEGEAPVEVWAQQIQAAKLGEPGDAVNTTNQVLHGGKQLSVEELESPTGAPPTDGGQTAPTTAGQVSAASHNAAGNEQSQ